MRERCDAGAAIVALAAERPAAYLAAPLGLIENHGAAESEEAMMAAIAGAGGIAPGALSLLLPVRQAALFRWCLATGFRLVNPMALMCRGAYAPPRGAWIPSILY